MNKYFLSICLLSFILSCKSQNYMPKPDFRYQIWRNNLLTQFEDLVAKNGGITQNGLSDMEKIRKEIVSIDSAKFCEVLNYSLLKKPTKNWKKIYCIYHIFEGEVTFELFTIILISRNNNAFGYTYSHNLDKYYEIRDEETIKKAIKINSNIEACNNGIFIVSEFDKYYSNKRNSLVIGMCMPNLDSFIKMYDADAVD